MPAPRRRLLAVVVVLVGAALSAPAAIARADGATTELPLATGKSIAGTVESADGTEVVLVVGPGERRRVPWAQLTPLGVYRARAALTKPDDGAGRLALAELASELGVWAEARVEYEKALALGALAEKAYLTAVAEAERRAVDSGIARAERAADAGDLAAALEIVRGLKIDFARALDGKKVTSLLASLDAKVAARDGEQRKAQADLERLALDVDRKREILVRLTEAKQHAALGDKLAKEAREDMPPGKVSGVRKLADAADDAYGAARRALGRLRRIVKKSEPERVQVLALLTDLDKSQYRLLFDAAKFFWDERVYARAEDFAARASYLDPVDPALLELRSQIREHRIRYRVSDITNARPR